MDENTQYFKELQPGTTLNGGKYVIEKKIGEGGFGITYKAVQQGLNRPVCIKEYFLAGRCVRNTLARTVQLQGISEELFEKYRQSFVHEAQTLASLHHQGIVEVIDVFDENNTSYMVMTFIEGRSLQSIVDQNGPLPYSDAVNYLTQIANAVDYIHQRHILHRDIKPENIMITADYKAILIDFGSARQFEEDKTQSHTAMLTHGYAPTEQYTRNSRKGAYTDIYSIGATLYFILTGQVPVEAAARIVEPMPEPKQLNPSLPDEANSTILKAMQLKPADRYQSVQELLHDLLNKNNPQQHTQTATPPPIPPTKPTPPTPKIPTTPPPPKTPTTPPPIQQAATLPSTDTNTVADTNSKQETDTATKSRKTVSVYHLLAIGILFSIRPLLYLIFPLLDMSLNDYDWDCWNFEIPLSNLLFPILTIILPAIILLSRKKKDMSIKTAIIYPSVLVTILIIAFCIGIGRYHIIWNILLLMYYIGINLLKIGKKNYTFFIAIASFILLSWFISFMGYDFETSLFATILLLITGYKIIFNNGKKWQAITTITLASIILILHLYNALLLFISMIYLITTLFIFIPAIVVEIILTVKYKSIK